MIPVIAGARLELEGTCNRCGLCCVAEVEGLRVVCEHLEAVIPVRPLGHPEASKCRVYEQRRSGMHIAMKDAQGNIKLIGRCFKNTWQEDQAVAPHIGRGCSLTVKVHQGQLVAFGAQSLREDARRG